MSADVDAALASIEGVYGEHDLLKVVCALWLASGALIGDIGDPRALLASVPVGVFGASINKVLVRRDGVAKGAVVSTHIAASNGNSASLDSGQQQTIVMVR